MKLRGEGYTQQFRERRHADAPDTLFAGHHITNRTQQSTKSAGQSGTQVLTHRRQFFEISPQTGGEVGEIYREQARNAGDHLGRVGLESSQIYGFIQVVMLKKFVFVMCCGIGRGYDCRTILIDKQLFLLVE